MDEALGSGSRGLKPVSRFAGVMLVGLLALATAAPPAASAPVQNGGFETGDFARWTVADQPGGNGSWFVYSGTSSPFSSNQIPAPPHGTFAAVSDQFSPGSHLLSRDIPLEANMVHVLSVNVFYVNRAQGFATPATLDFNPAVPNQQYRVDVLKATAASNSLAPDDVLRNVFRTDVGDPQSVGPTWVTADLTRFAGSTVRVRFAEVDNQSFLQAGVDALKVTSFPRVAVNDTRLSEGDSGQRTLFFTIRLSAASTKQVTVNFITADWTAKRLSDYVFKQGTLTFSPGQTSKSVGVKVNGDTLKEPNEDLFLVLFEPTNAKFGDSVGVGTIRDDD